MKERTVICNSEETGKLGVRHLKNFWARSLARRDGGFIEATEKDWRFDNLVLSALGLPVEETTQYLLQLAPTFDEFENWILEKNNFQTDDLQIERLNGVLSGAADSEAVLRKLREIDEAEDVLTAEDLKFWDANGYVIVREAIPAEQARESEKAVWEFLEMNSHDPRSWYQKPIGKGIMMNFYYHPVLARNRRSRRIHKAFAQLWKTADLWATTDRTSFNPPETAEFPFQGPGLHWDMSLKPPFHFGTQGLIYLCDTPAEQGAFCCVPGFQNVLAAWLDELPDGVDPRAVELSAQAVPIAARAGDLVIWHHALPHGSSPNRGHYPRIVQYLNMYPLEFRENMEWL